MRIAFYAPLKPPDHKTPSGDRRIARLFLHALRQAAHEPFVASRLRSFDPLGGESRQARMAARGKRTAERLVTRWRRAPETAPGLWFTYHLYYKAPDWIGPAVAAALGIPYVVAEAAFAAKRAGGPWDAGHRAVAAALRNASLEQLNLRDLAAVSGIAAYWDTLGWVHFGLGTAADAQVRVQWPDGVTGPWIHLNANQFSIIQRGATEGRPWTPPQN